MRILLLFIASILAAQTYTYDSDGRRVVLPSVSEDRRTRVVEEGPNGRVIEEIVRRKDPDGNPLPEERVRTMEKTGPAGETVVETLTYRADFNGRLSLAEKTTLSTAKAGDKTNTTTVVERPSVNGALSVVEKAAAETTIQNGREVTSRSIFRANASGGLSEAVRESVEKASVNGKMQETVTTYQNASTGQLELSQQKVTVSVAHPDGSSTSEITIYGVTAPGRLPDGKLKVREQQLLETKRGPGNTVVESFSVRRPDVTDSKLGAYQKVGERVREVPKP